MPRDKSEPIAATEADMVFVVGTPSVINALETMSLTAWCLVNLPLTRKCMKAPSVNRGAAMTRVWHIEAKSQAQSNRYTDCLVVHKRQLAVPTTKGELCGELAAMKETF